MVVFFRIRNIENNKNNAPLIRNVFNPFPLVEKIYIKSERRT